MSIGNQLRLVAIASAVFLAQAASAGTISLAWSPVSGASGYRVYYGTISGNYGSQIDAGGSSSATLTGLQDCRAYYIAVKAYNSAGESAGYSNEVTGWSRPAINTATPASRRQGDVGAIQIVGANFKEGASVAINNPDLDMSTASVVDCNHIQLTLAIAPAAAGRRPAQIGAFDVTVINPDGTCGTRAHGFTIDVDPARFDVNQSDPSTRGRLEFLKDSHDTTPQSGDVAGRSVAA